MLTLKDSNIHLLKLNITFEPKTQDGGIIICNYGKKLSEIYLEKNYNSNYQDEPFYLKIGDTIITSIENKIKLDDGLCLDKLLPILYNIKFNSTVIAVYYTNESVYINEFISYN